MIINRHTLAGKTDPMTVEIVEAMQPMLEIEMGANRPAEGDRVLIIDDSDGNYGQHGTRGLYGIIVEDDCTQVPFHVIFDNGNSTWYQESQVQNQGKDFGFFIGDSV